jgi:hypothetical protein
MRGDCIINSDPRDTKGATQLTCLPAGAPDPGKLGHNDFRLVGAFECAVSPMLTQWEGFMYLPRLFNTKNVIAARLPRALYEMFQKADISLSGFYYDHKMDIKLNQTQWQSVCGTSYIIFSNDGHNN